MDILHIGAACTQCDFDTDRLTAEVCAPGTGRASKSGPARLGPRRSCWKDKATRSARRNCTRTCFSSPRTSVSALTRYMP